MQLSWDNLCEVPQAMHPSFRIGSVNWDLGYVVASLPPASTA